jgi:hypothetical protein
VDKKSLIGIILCLILLFNLTVPICGESRKIDVGEETESLSSDRDIFFLHFAFVSGEYENRTRWFTYFDIWNSNYSIHSIDVLGFSPYYPDKIMSIKAYRVWGSFRIGYIGRHHCCIFAFGPGGVTVEGNEMRMY